MLKLPEETSEIKFLRVKEVARILRCAPLAVYKMIREKKIRCHKIAGKFLIPYSEIARIAQEGIEPER